MAYNSPRIDLYSGHALWVGPKREGFGSPKWIYDSFKRAARKFQASSIGIVSKLSFEPDGKSVRMVILEEAGTEIEVFVQGETQHLKLVGELVLVSRKSRSLIFPFSPFAPRENYCLAFKFSRKPGQAPCETSTVAQEPEQDVTGPSNSELDQDLFNMIYVAARRVVVEEDWWEPLPDLGKELRKLKPNFTPKNHGFQNLAELVEACGDMYEITKDYGCSNQMYFRFTPGHASLNDTWDKATISQDRTVTDSSEVLESNHSIRSGKKKLQSQESDSLYILRATLSSASVGEPIDWVATKEKVVILWSRSYFTELDLDDLLRLALKREILQQTSGELLLRTKRVTDYTSRTGDFYQRLRAYVKSVIPIEGIDKNELIWAVAAYLGIKDPDADELQTLRGAVRSAIERRVVLQAGDIISAE